MVGTADVGQARPVGAVRPDAGPPDPPLAGSPMAGSPMAAGAAMAPSAAAAPGAAVAAGTAEVSGAAGASAGATLSETDLLTGVAALHAALDALTAVRATSPLVSDERLRAVSSALAQGKARIDAVLMVIARDLCERDAAHAAGAVNTGQLLAADFGGDRADANRLVHTARQLTNTPIIEDALAVGTINRDQAAVITRQLNKLPAVVEQAEHERAERSLLHAARLLSIDDLGRAATRAADAFRNRAAADAHEEDQLVARERRARRASTFWMRDNRDGTWRGTFTVPDLEAESLRTAVEALSAPRRYHLTDRMDAAERLTDHRDAVGGAGSAGGAGASDDDSGEGGAMSAATGLVDGWPFDKRHRQGRAFATLCTHLPADALPNAGGISALLTVNIDYDTTRAALQASLNAQPIDPATGSVSGTHQASSATNPSDVFGGYGGQPVDSGETGSGVNGPLSAASRGDIAAPGDFPGGTGGPSMAGRPGETGGLMTGLGPGTLASGTRVSAARMREIACGAGIIPQVLGGASLPLDLGQTQRLFTATQRRALAHRDKGCTYPGCDRPPQWCEGHHWRDAWKPRRLGGPHGPTDIDNGGLLCAYHHRLVHERHIQIRERDGHLEYLVPPLIGATTQADYGGDLFNPVNPPGQLQWQRNYRRDAR